MQEFSIQRTAAAAEYWTAEGCFILELSNDGGDPAVSIARARVTPGVTTKPHCLGVTAERYVILEGEGEVYIGSAPAETVAPGQVVRIPAGVSQSIRNTGTADLVFLCICTPRFQWSNYRSLAPWGRG